MKRSILSLTIAGLLFLPAAVFANAGPDTTSLANTVRHRLVMLPYYGVFDTLGYQVNGDTVTLTGQVTRPTLRHDAEAVVSRIAGVNRVVNDIEVLPLSRYDDSIRLGVLRAVYGQLGFEKYALGADPSIHIIVKNGHVWLEGEVGNKMDSQLAYVRANSVSGAFSVTNDLQVSPAS